MTVASGLDSRKDIVTNCEERRVSRSNSNGDLALLPVASLTGGRDAGVLEKTVLNPVFVRYRRAPGIRAMNRISACLESDGEAYCPRFSVKRMYSC